MAGDDNLSGDRDLNSRWPNHMGLIYVNPQGRRPAVIHGCCQDIRATFSRMAMDDEEAFPYRRRHSFGKAHGAAPESHKPEPKRIDRSEGLGWISNYGTDMGDTVSSVSK